MNTAPDPRFHELRVERVVTMPKPLEPGVLYVSERFQLAMHLCACGACNEETVMPFYDRGTGWLKIETPDGRVTLRPSVGNKQFPCRSHYWITENRIEWLAPFQ